MSENPGIQSNLIGPAAADEIDIGLIGRLLWRQKALIGASITVALILALGASFLLPKAYVAQATILPTTSSDTTAALAAGVANQLGAAAGMLGGLGGLGIGKSAELVEILNSRSMADRVITRTGLEKKLSGWKTRGELVTKVVKMTTVQAPTLKSKVVTIQVKAADPEVATSIANTYVDELKDMLDEIGFNDAAKNRRFIENQLARTKRDLALAEEKLTNFQAENRLASLPDTVVASIKAMSDLEAQKVGAEVELKTTDEALGAVKSRVDSLQADPNSLVDLQIKRRGLAAQSTALTQARDAFMRQLMNLPPKAMALARLQRDVQVQNAVYLALTQQLETAMISENQESDAFLPLDKAEIPEKPSEPKRSQLLAIGFLFGTIVGVVTALAGAYRSLHTGPERVG